MPRNRWLVCTFMACALSVTCAPLVSNAQDAQTALVNDEPRFTTLRIFGSTPQAGFLAINNRRMVTGSFLDVDEFGEGRFVGFALLERFLHPIDFENAVSVIVTSLNDRGDMVGLLGRTGSPEIAFRYSHGELEAINVPDTTLPPLLRGINNHGDIVGRVQINFREDGFLLSDGRLTLIAPPPDGVRPTTIFGINDSRDIVGCYDLRDGLFRGRGFMFRKGAYTIIEVLGARSTCPTDINNRGTIVGGYVDAASTVHGFLLRNGRHTLIDIPNSISTSILSINDSGDIVGKYQDTSFREHGFRSNIDEFVRRR